MPLSTYDPKQVSVIFGGVPLSGFADGTFINVERDNDTFSKTSGSDGIVSRAKSNDRSGTMTITLAQTSPSNDVLEAVALLDEKTNTGIVPVLVQDKSGRSKHFSALAWIRKSAPAEYSKEISNREWVIDLADYIPFNGGNANFEAS